MQPDQLAKQLRLPVIAAPMFIVSGPELVLAQCKAGVIGSFPALNARTCALLDEWLVRIAGELAAFDRQHPGQPAAPFAVNLIVHPSNDRLQDDLALCVKHRVPIIITSLGCRSDVIEAIHGYGGIVLHDIVNQKFAIKAAEAGVDGLILVAAGAGGHAGVQSPFALVQETRAWFKGPIALSGAIANGRSILAAQVMGADFAYIGSAFIATDEANATNAYKDAIVAGQAADIVYTDAFSGILANYLAPSIAAAGLNPNDLSRVATGEIDLNARNIKAWRDIWGAGQGLGAVTSRGSVQKLVTQLTDEYNNAIQSIPQTQNTRRQPAHGAGA